jgi:hypothetical protein
MGILIDGKWIDDEESYRKDGAFVRPATGATISTSRGRVRGATAP